MIISGEKVQFINITCQNGRTSHLPDPQRNNSNGKRPHQPGSKPPRNNTKGTGSHSKPHSILLRNETTQLEILKKVSKKRQKKRR